MDTVEMLGGPEEIINMHGRLFPTDIMAYLVSTMEFKLKVHTQSTWSLIFVNVKEPPC